MRIMTIGIGYRTDNHIVCLVDTRLVDYGKSRHYNTGDKIVPVSFGVHHGVVYASDDENKFMQVFSAAGEVAKAHENDKKISIDDFVDSVAKKLRMFWKKTGNTMAIAEEDCVESERGTFVDDKSYNEYRAEQLKKARDAFKRKKKDDSVDVVFALYDGRKKCFRMYELENDIGKEVFNTPLIIGSGEDEADRYIAVFEQKTTSKKRKVAEVLFTITGAYNFSTINRDVGGTPKIAIVDDKTTHFLLPEESALLVNTAAARITHILSWIKHAEYCERIYDTISSPVPMRAKNVDALAKDFKKSIDQRASPLEIDVSLAALKLQVWGEIASRKLFLKD